MMPASQVDEYHGEAMDGSMDVMQMADQLYQEICHLNMDPHEKEVMKMCVEFMMVCGECSSMAMHLNSIILKHQGVVTPYSIAHHYNEMFKYVAECSADDHLQQFCHPLMCEMQYYI